MSDVADYDTDILLWSERQAALLRDLKARAGAVPNELDLENVAEEIESVGRAEFRAFESYLTQIFVHLMKAASNADPSLRTDWETEILNFQIEAIKAVTPSMLHRLDVQDVWKYATLKARNALKRYGESLDGVPAFCPFEPEIFLVDSVLDLAPLLDAMRQQAERETRPD
ncbi:DUF29 domain-containing protein [Chelatococcus sambhunathii]|uniref:DUF29 domain-containing protein n=1 Tax=Chelatococcus sambhunathii TaxID=363953 RepID=A0ABU1DI21_9HYPH|nr:DUF29 domain-containing protein [Chelatococcus sambhunathii]MDR4307781.1 DUF29 domain-containing protein [Chelatococcus sambhunathii]